MASGVLAQQEVLDTYTALKDKKTYRYMIMSFVKNNTEIAVIKAADRDATHEQFLEDIREQTEKKLGCYAVYDIEFKLESGQERSRLVFISWAPMTTAPKQKMLVASSSGGLKKKISDCYKYIEAFELDDIAEERLIEVCKAGDRGN